ncbi:putative hydrolase (metallo-beta-lactamase superfamily) [Halobacteroides halobius DSM 5150]|uniref:Putative hydrolase (Metallo-beta-lactamase superfamily) n=1 Tax=Halobacteroides halobius (strain ATCC 35273 / DSM 5150 / MD-1) TaxID=748449 RepID=L0KAE3_HALHC|nr:MBL fold metallo-hydrolase [Halobacteroides halobius]AGB41073.1 putative hydrolase (metallo-beta-lactamase superfamily) [Halobacteroides halobius DSM 5150]
MCNKEKGLLVSIIVLNLTIALTGILIAKDKKLTVDNKLRIHFIDVGQGNATLIQLPNQEVMLIDAGKNNQGPKVVNYIEKQGIEKIDYLIGTHPHADHIGGLDRVIYNCKVGQIYLPQVTHTTETYLDLLQAIKSKRKQIIATQVGLKLIASSNLQARIVGPVNNNYQDLNNWSVITKIKYKQNSFLFTGDTEAKIEADLIDTNINLQADLLQVPHHGSNSSTTISFLKSVNPKYAVISAGDNNRYGHPATEVVARLKQRGINIYRTDKQGTIIAISDGEDITFNVEAREDTSLTKSTSVKITYLSLEEEVVEIRNQGSNKVDISHWRLVSTTGGQNFVFSAGTIIEEESTIKVVAGPNATAGEDKLVWDDWYIWNNDGDGAKLYNSKGELVSKYLSY